MGWAPTGDSTPSTPGQGPWVRYLGGATYQGRLPGRSTIGGTVSMLIGRASRRHPENSPWCHRSPHGENSPLALWIHRGAKTGPPSSTTPASSRRLRRPGRGCAVRTGPRPDAGVAAQDGWPDNPCGDPWDGHGPGGGSRGNLQGDRERAGEIAVFPDCLGNGVAGPIVSRLRIIGESVRMALLRVNQVGQVEVLRCHPRPCNPMYRWSYDVGDCFS